MSTAIIVTDGRWVGSVAGRATKVGEQSVVYCERNCRPPWMNEGTCVRTGMWLINLLIHTLTSQLMSPTHANRPLPKVCAISSVVVNCSFVIRRGYIGPHPAPCKRRDKYGAILLWNSETYWSG